MIVPWYLMAMGEGGDGYKTASGPIVSVSDALAAPLRSLLVNIEPVQDLHGFDNPWPAGGGKNKVNSSLFYVAGPPSGITLTLDDGTITANGSVASDTTYAFYNFTLPTGAYAFSCTRSGISVRLLKGYSYVLVNNGSFTVDDATQVYRLALYFASGTTYSNATVSKCQIELGSTATPYAPYSNICPISGWSAVNVWVKPTYDPTANPTATIQLGDTFYGGTLDVTNGVLTVDRASILLNEFSFDGISSPNRHIFRATYNDIIPNVKLPRGDAYSWDALCSSYGYKPYALISASDDGKYAIATSGDRIVFIDHRCSTVEDFVQLNASVQLVYPLATPIEIPLTPTEISTLQGQNNVWADSGDVTIEYLASGGANADLMKLAVAFMGRR